MTGKDHAKLLGLFFWIYDGIQIIGLIIGMLVMIGMSGFMFSQFSRMPHNGNEPPPEFILGFMGVIIIIAIVVNILFLIPAIIAGYGLRNEKSWAKTWVIVACCLAVLNIPLGTALGVYGLWFVFGEEGKAYFDNPFAKAETPPPPPNNWR